MKLLDVKTIAAHQLELTFSDPTQGGFDGARYLADHKGPSLKTLRDPPYFSRCFVDAGALCWPNGLELSAVRLYELSHAVKSTAGSKRFRKSATTYGSRPALIQPKLGMNPPNLGISPEHSTRP